LKEGIVPIVLSSTMIITSFVLSTPLKYFLSGFVTALIGDAIAWLAVRRERGKLERILSEARKYEESLRSLKIQHPQVGETEDFLDKAGGRYLKIAERIVRYTRYGLATALIFVCLLSVLEAGAFESYHVAISLLGWVPIAVPLALGLALADILYRALTLARVRRSLGKANWLKEDLEKVLLEETRPSNYAHRVLGYDPRCYDFLGGSIAKIPFKEGSKSEQIHSLYLPKEHRNILPEFVHRVLDGEAVPVAEGVYVDPATGSLIRRIQEDVYYIVLRDGAGEIHLHAFLRLSPYAGRNFLIARKYIEPDAKSFDSAVRAALPSLDRRVTVIPCEGTTGFVAGLATVGDAGTDLVMLWLRYDLDTSVTLEIARGGAEKKEMLIEFLANAVVEGRVILLVHNEPSEDPRQNRLLDILLDCASSSAIRELPRVACERLAIRLIEEGASPLIFATKPLGGELPIEAERALEEIPSWLSNACGKPIVLAARGPMARRLHTEPIMAAMRGERDEVVFGFPLNWAKLQEVSEVVRDVSKRIKEKIELAERTIAAELATGISKREGIRKLRGELANISKEKLLETLGPVLRELLGNRELEDKARRLAAIKRMLGMKVELEDELESLAIKVVREALKRPTAMAPAPDRIEELTKRIVGALYNELKDYPSLTH